MQNQLVERLIASLDSRSNMNKDIPINMIKKIKQMFGFMGPKNYLYDYFLAKI